MNVDKEVEELKTEIKRLGKAEADGTYKVCAQSACRARQYICLLFEADVKHLIWATTTQLESFLTDLISIIRGSLMSENADSSLCFNCPHRIDQIIRFLQFS